MIDPMIGLFLSAFLLFMIYTFGRATYYSWNLTSNSLLAAIMTLAFFLLFLARLLKM